MTKDEALKLALDALEFKNVLNMQGRYSIVDPEKSAVAQLAIKEVLTHPNDIELFHRAVTAPEKWIDLTDEEIKAVAKRPWGEIPMTGRMWVFAGALLEKIKEKNT